MKEHINKILFALCCAAFLIFLIACENEGPAEKAGEKVDEAIEETQEKMEDAGEQVKDAVEEGGEKLEEAGEKMQN